MQWSDSTGSVERLEWMVEQTTILELAHRHLDTIVTDVVATAGPEKSSGGGK